MKFAEIEYKSKAEIKRFQEEKLKIALLYLKNNSPFYQKLFKENNIDIKNIEYLEDLQKIPFTEKQDLQLCNNKFLCVPCEKVIDFITTSGTLGDPVTFAMTDADLDRLAYNEKISFTCAGVKPADTVQLMTTIDKRFMAGLAYFLGLRLLGAGVVRVGNGIPELQWDTINRIKPNTIMCVPSFILHIIKYAEEHGIDYRNSSVKKVVCIGENLREQDFSLNLLGQRIKEKWDIELYSTYASTEMATTFAECKYGCGGHHHPELIICEVVDSLGNIVKNGEAGELVVTTLGVEGMPLLRFKTGDLVRFHTE
ncbi:MAG: AMP-binding protein, partial [Prevotellaceae bacterium]|nr:AMP-binding protein [Prevotellaceae bacterium]